MFFTKEFSISKAQASNPVLQMAILVALHAIASHIINANAWQYALIALLFYSAANVLIGLPLRNHKWYLLSSLLVFVIFNLLVIKIASYYSQIPFFKVSYIRPVFLSIWMCYPVFLGISVLVRFVARWANDEFK